MIFDAILAPFWDPPGLKKLGFRVEGVAFVEKSRGSKPSSKLERFRSIFGVILAPFWDPPGLKKRGFRVEGVAFFETSRGSNKSTKFERC